MRVMQRGAQVVCVVSALPWGASGRVASAIAAVTARGSIALTALHRPSFHSTAGGRKLSSLAFAPPSLASSTSHQPQGRRCATSDSANGLDMSMTPPSSPSGDVQQTKNRVALLQLPVTADKAQNIRTARDYIQRAYEAGAQLCVLPEIWNSPYATAAFPDYAEPLPDVGARLNQSADDGSWGASSVMLMEMAAATRMYIVGGSVPERSAGDIYNTCLVVDPAGTVVAKHRKVHLFDVDVPGGIRFRESETLTGGDEATYFDVEGGDDDGGGLGRIGIGICYDLRFPEYALLLTQRHRCAVLVYPGAFNLTTGPAHWELLQRARAVDGQCFVLTASPARTPPPPPSAAEGGGGPRYPHYAAWGHSTVVSPWGEVVATCEEAPALVVTDLDMEQVEDMRRAIPTRGQKRHDLY